MKSPRGFTLIEVMVALAVVAVTLLAGLQASAALTRASERQEEQWLAEICAANELARLRLVRQLPGTGTTTVGCEQGRRQLQVRLTVQTTPNPNFRRIDAAVLRPSADGETDAGTLLQVSTVMGRF
ncbi:MAG: type II secretion system protein GspI [Comamonadaceae bacterium]|jgi:general secretion pathway protein I|nr:type II secretion system protein GspI [Comamonadaceae bacterium]